MMKKLLDLKDTFEGKFLAVLMSVILVLSMTNVLAFADSEGPDGEDGAAQIETNVEEPAAQEPTTTPEPPSTPEPTTPETPAAPAVDEPSEPVEPVEPAAPTDQPVTVEEAVVTFETEHAFVTVSDQLLTGKKLTVQLHKKLAFKAAADDGYEIESVKAKNSANADVPVTTQDGVSTIAEEYVDGTLVITVKAKAVEKKEASAPDTKPITNDTVIEADAQGEPEAPEADQPADADAANELAPMSVSALTANPALGSYNAFVVYLDTNGQPTGKEEETTLPAGSIAENASSVDGYRFVDARVGDKVIAFAGTLDGSVYYAAEDSIDSGVAMQLQEGERIELRYQTTEGKHEITYDIVGDDGEAGNAVDGSDLVDEGAELNIRVDTARGYKVAEVTANGKAVAHEGNFYKVDSVTEDLVVKVTFQKITSVIVEASTSVSPTNFHEAWFEPISYKELIDSDSGIKAKVPVGEDGASYQFKMHSGQSGNPGFSWQLDSLQINGVDLAVPLVYVKKAIGTPAASVTTVLPSGTTVTVTLTDIESPNRTDRTNYIYTVSIENALEDVKVTRGNFRGSTHAEVMPSIGEGIEAQYRNNEQSEWTNVTSYQPIQTLVSGNVTAAYLRVKLSEGYENLAIVLNDKTTTLQSMPGYYEGSDGWAYFTLHDDYKLKLQTLSMTASRIGYTVSYDAAGGEGTPEDGLTYDTVDNTRILVSPVMPVREGHVFLGWKIEGEGDVVYPGDVLEVFELVAKGAFGESRTLKLIADWASPAPPNTPIPVLVKSYYENDQGVYEDGTNGTADNPTLKTSVKGYVDSKVVKFQADPSVREGYEYDNDANNVLSGTVLGDGSFVLKQYYKRSVYQVKYDLDGGVTTSPKTTFDGLHYGEATPTIDEPTKDFEGGFLYEFAGWSPSVDKTVTKSVTYVAQWTPVEAVTLTYDLNGGTGTTPKPVHVPKGTTISEFAPQQGFAYGDYTFKGWATDKDSIEPVKSLVMNEDKTLYASWVAKFSVMYGVQTYKDQGNPDEVVVKEVNPPNAPTFFELKAGKEPQHGADQSNERLSWMPEIVQYPELGIDGSETLTDKYFYFWDYSSNQKMVSVLYISATKTSELSDGDVTVANASQPNFKAIRQGMVNVRTHYVDAGGAIAHDPLTGEVKLGLDATEEIAAEQLYFAWQYDNKVNLSVSNASDEWVLNTVAFSDGGTVTSAGNSTLLSGVSGNSTVDIYLTPKYTVNYYDVTSGESIELTDKAQTGTVGSGAAGTSVLPAGIELIDKLAVQELPSVLGYSYEGWNTAEGMDGDQVDAGSALSVDRFDASRALKLYAKGTQLDYSVTYSWKGDVPEGVTLPQGGTYHYGDTFVVSKEKYGENKDNVVTKRDEFGNVTDVYTFSGWTPSEDFKVTGDKVVTGTWKHETKNVPTARLVYEWEWIDRTPGTDVEVPNLPTDEKNYKLNEPYSLAETPAEGDVIEHFDAYGNVDGRWTFEGWADPGNGKMLEGGVTVVGTWTWTSVEVAKHNVAYVWDGDVPEGVTPPNGPTGLVKGQPFEVDGKQYGPIETKDQYGNVTGIYTFGGWDKSGTLLMGDEDVTIKGTWTLERITPETHKVIYQWIGNVPTGEYKQTLPTDGTAYVKGQPFSLTEEYPVGTIVEHRDSYGNVDGSWRFEGWTIEAWADPDTLVMGDSDVIVNGRWVYSDQDVQAYSVKYVWTGDVPTGEYTPKEPIDPNSYVLNQDYALNEAAAAFKANETTIDEFDEYGNVKGVWTFKGWTDPGNGTMIEGGVTIEGAWHYEPKAVDTFKVTYDWGTENVPANVLLPQDFQAYVPGQPYDVNDEYSAGYEVETHDIYGNLTGVYSFSGWTDPAGGKMVEGGVIVTGSWSYEAETVPAHRVTYDWGNPGNEVLEAYNLPVDGNEYVLHQPYSVDATPYEPVDTHDAYSNVNGRWTFSGWNDPNNGVMGESDVTIVGAWVFEPVAVPSHTVSYEWGASAPAGVSLPVDVTGLMNGQSYDVDTDYTESTVIETLDEFGNVNGRWTFSGWTDPNNGVMGESDVTITGSWAYEDVKVETYGVTYAWDNAPDGEYEQALPTDDAEYAKNQPVVVDEKFTSETTVDHLDAFGNVDGRWTFSGWNVPNNGNMPEGGMEIRGFWMYEPVEVPAYGVTYAWTDAPAGAYEQALPTDVTTYVRGQDIDVDKKYTAETTVDHLDAFGNVDGRWTFSGWNVPNGGVMGDANVTITGLWTYEDVAVESFGVTYEWTDAPTGAGYEQTLPTDDAKYVPGQTFPVDGTFAKGATVEHKDQYGNVDGRWTFSGWSIQGEGTMVHGGVTVQGAWVYAAEDVTPYFVTYEWENAPTGAQYVQTLPFDGASYVTGQPVSVDDTFTNETTVDHFDAHGNVDGRWTFGGWNVPNDGKMPEGGMTIEGAWTYEDVAVPTPPTPDTPTTPTTPDTPTPTTPTTPTAPVPGTPPADNPVTPLVTPIVNALENAAQAVIGDNETPLAQNGEPRETEIGDNGTPLAQGAHVWCWVHWYIILGIIVTAVYAACVALRRGLFSHKLKKYEDNLTGGGDPAPGAPTRDDAAPTMPKGAPAGATMAVGLGE